MNDHTVAMLHLEFQYSFTRVTPSTASVSDLSGMPPSRLLAVAVNALYSTITPSEAGQRDAVRWLVAEYGSMTGLTKATQGLILMGTRLQYN